MLSFTNVYFFESGLFNGLQPIQIKNPDTLFETVRLACQVAGIGSGPAPFLLSPESVIVIRPFRMTTTDFGLWQYPALGDFWWGNDKVAQLRGRPDRSSNGNAKVSKRTEPSRYLD